MSDSLKGLDKFSIITTWGGGLEESRGAQSVGEAKTYIKKTLQSGKHPTTGEQLIGLRVEERSVNTVLELNEKAINAAQIWLI